MRAPGREFADPLTGDDHSSIDRLLAEGSPVVIVFTEDECSVCEELEARLRRLVPRLRGRVTVRILRDAPLARSFGVPGFPSAAAVDTVGRMSHGTISGADAVEDLVRLVAGLESAAEEAAGVSLLNEVPAYVSDATRRRA